MGKIIFAVEQVLPGQAVVELAPAAVAAVKVQYLNC